jgi:hypothetical protein
MSHYDYLGITSPFSAARPVAPTPVSTGPSVPRTPRQPAPSLPAKLPTRLPSQTQAQAQNQAKTRVVAAKMRENAIRSQAQGLATRAKADQDAAKQSRGEVEKLTKVVTQCGDAYKRAKDAHDAAVKHAQTPRQRITAALIAENAAKVRAAQLLMEQTKRAYDAARTALARAIAASAQLATSPAQQTLPVVQKALEEAKQDTVEETKVAIDVGVPPVQLPPPPPPAEKVADQIVAEVAKDAPVVAAETVAVAEGSAKQAETAANDAGVPQVPPAVDAPPPAGSAPTTDADASAPPAVLEEAAKQAQDAVNEAVGAPPGSALPMIAAVGVVGLIAYALFSRKG